MVVLLEFPMEGCALVTLNRPQAKNALSSAMRRELVRLFAQELPGRARVVVLTGAGDAFCAGLDLKELGSGGDTAGLIATPALDAAHAMRAFPGPVIGAVNGAAITGGLEIALACDVLLASESARFADTHGRVGILPAWGLSQVLPRRIGEGRAKAMSFTGNFVDAQRAMAWGLVNEVFPAQDLLPAALRMAGDMLGADAATLLAYKQLIDEGMRLPLGDALALEQERAGAWALQLSSAGLAQSGAAVTERGRAQAPVTPAPNSNR